MTTQEEMRREYESLKEQAKRILLLLNIPHIAGREYLAEMIAIYYQVPYDVISNKKVCELIAKSHKTSSKLVNQAIRNAIQAACNYSDEKTIKRIINYDGKGKWCPSIEQFVNDVANYLKKQEGQQKGSSN